MGRHWRPTLVPLGHRRLVHAHLGACLLCLLTSTVLGTKAVLRLGSPLTYVR